MRRISTSTRVVDKFGAGKDGFTNGDPVGGVASTDLEDVWFDHVQEEIATVIESAGMALDSSNRGQLLAALFRLTVQHGQCRLAKSGANALLSPYNGNKLVIGGVMRTIPAAGVSLAPTGLTPNTLYYVYAYMNGATMTLEASTTSHSTDSTTGIEIKTGDVSRTLVGMVYPMTGPAFADNYQQRLVISWFNRRNILAAGNFTTGRTTASNTPTELNSEIRNNFLTWGDEAVNMNAYGIVTLAGSPGQQASTGIAVNSSSILFDASIQYQRDTNSNIGTATIGTSGLLTEGFNFATVLGYVSASSATWSTNNFLKTTIRG